MDGNGHIDAYPKTRTRAATLVAAVLLVAFLMTVAAPASAFAAKPVTPKPVIDALSVYEGEPGTPVTITGSNFGSRAAQCVVYFEGTVAQIQTFSDTSIVVTVPAGAQPGYVYVEVKGVASNGLYFMPVTAPTLATISSDNAPVGSSLTLTGSGFGPQTTGSVTIAGVTAAVSSWSDTQIVVTVPNAGAGYVGVWQSGVCSNGLFFMPGGTPAIESVSSPFALVGDSVTVTGQNFGPSPTVTVGGVSVTPSTASETQITFTVPDNAPPGYIGVWKGDVCSNGAFLNVGGRIDALSSWWAAPGSELTISGAGFGPTQDRVTLAGVDVQVVSWADTSITFVVPTDGIEGYVGVWRGAACSNGVWLLPIGQASVAAVDCTAAAPGATITITGTGFEGAQAENYRVMIGSNELAVVSWTDTQIVAVVPTWLADSGYVGVWKKGVASNGVWLEITP